MNKDITVSGSARSSAFSFLLNLEKCDMYFFLRLLQRLFGIHPIHVKCQSRRAITGDLNASIQELASVAFDLDTFGEELFAESKVQAMGMKSMCQLSRGLSCVH